MHRNAIWIGFLVVVVAVAFWFILRAGNDLFHYFQLSGQAPASIEKWSVVEHNTDQYGVNAQFSFDFQEKIYHGQGEVGHFYPNPWAANRAMEKFSSQTWSVWLDPKRPNQGVLEKAFPVKAAISAFVLLGLTIYFVSLGVYVGLKNGKE